MHLKFYKYDLISSINIVSKAVPSKTPMSILECILLDASETGINLVANDLEFGIETGCPGTILEPGKVALDAKLFSEIIRRLPQEDNVEVSIETDSQLVTTIRCENSVFKIKGRDGEEFTNLPSIDKEDFITLSQYTLKNIINQTIFSISMNDANKKMTGEYLEVDGDSLSLTSLDGHRISIRREKLSKSYFKMSAIVPGRALQELSKILSSDMEDEIQIYFSKNHMLFVFNHSMVVTRLIDGEYFHVAQMMSEDYELKVVANRRKLLDCIERSTIFIRENDRQPLVLDIEGDLMGLKINTDLGRMDAEIPVQKIGNDLMIGFNPKYLIDALRSIEDEEVKLYMSIPRSPLFIKNDEESYNYMILPVNFNARSI